MCKIATHKNLIYPRVHVPKKSKTKPRNMSI